MSDGCLKGTGEGQQSKAVVAVGLAQAAPALAVSRSTHCVHLRDSKNFINDSLADERPRPVHLFAVAVGCSEWISAHHVSPNRENVQACSKNLFLYKNNFAFSSHSAFTRHTLQLKAG